MRILPRIAFGVHPAGIDGLTPDSPGVLVFHHFLGSWKKRGGWQKRGWALAKLRRKLSKWLPYLIRCGFHCIFACLLIVRQLV